MLVVQPYAREPMPNATSPKYVKKFALVSGRFQKNRLSIPE